MPRSPALLATLAAAAFALAPCEARETWFDHYESGVEALEAGRAEQALESLARALELKPRGGYLRTYGNNYIRYAPHAHLGLARYELDECERALASFERAKKEIADEPALASRVRKAEEHCAQRLAPKEPAPPAAPPLRHVDPGLVVAGVQAYLNGDFPVSTRSFEALVEQAPDSPTMRVLLAASLHGEAATGDEPERLLSRCRSQLRRALGLDPDLELDPRFFSPGLVALLARQR